MRRLSAATGIACLLTLSACLNTKEPEALKPIDKSARELAKQPYDYATTAREGGVTARLWVPAGESASVGTWQAEITFPDSSVLSTGGERDGTIANVWLRDLGGDGTLDLIVATTSAGSGSYGSAAVYSLVDGRCVNREMAPFDAAGAPGYRGHDNFSILNGELRRSHPVYGANDVNARPTGGLARYRYDFAGNRWVPEG
jgi:hypothetical protein